LAQSQGIAPQITYPSCVQQTQIDFVDINAVQSEISVVNTNLKTDKQYFAAIQNQILEAEEKLDFLNLRENTVTI
jgi:hypothetical protein